MSGYECNTPGCSVGDCPNCVYIRGLEADKARYEYVRDDVLMGTKRSELPSGFARHIDDLSKYPKAWEIDNAIDEELGRIYVASPVPPSRDDDQRRATIGETNV